VTVEPGDEMATGAGGHSRLRASHADREQVIDVLKAAFVEGRLARDEFDLRVGQVLASRTYADLNALTTDIPAGLAAAPPPPGPLRAKGNTPADANVRSGDRAIMATAIFAGLAMLASLFAGRVTGFPSDPLFLGGIGSAFVSLSLLARQMRSSGRDNRSGGQLPQQRAINTGPRAGRRAASAASAKQLPYTGKPRRSRVDAARSHLPRPQLSS